MPPKKAKKPRKPRVARSATEKKKGLKQKQKQKQQVNVNVSSAGSGYIPIPQAPEINYSLLSQLLRPAATVDVPIRAQANPEPIAARPAEQPTIVEQDKPKRKYTRKSKIPIAEGYMSESEPMVAKAMTGPFDITSSGSFSEREAEAIVKQLPLGTEFIVEKKKGSRKLEPFGNPMLEGRSFQVPFVTKPFGP